MMVARIAETVASLTSPVVHSSGHDQSHQQQQQQAENISLQVSSCTQSTTRMQQQQQPPPPWMSWNLGMTTSTSNNNVESREFYHGMQLSSSSSSSSTGVAAGRMQASADRHIIPDKILDWKKQLGLISRLEHPAARDQLVHPIAGFPLDDDNGCSLTSLVNGYKTAASFGGDLQPRVTTTGSFIVPGCAEFTHGSALGLLSNSSIPPVSRHHASKSSLFEFGGTRGSCSTPSFCVAGSPVTVDPAMPPKQLMASPDAATGLVSFHGSTNHDHAATSCCLDSPPSMVDSDHSNSSAASLISFDESSLQEDAGQYNVVQNPSNNSFTWMQQQAAENSFVDSRFWMQHQPSTTMSPDLHASVHRPIAATSTAISESLFSEDTISAFRMNPASTLDNVTAGIGKLGHLAGSVRRPHAVVVGSADESTHNRGPRSWCPQQQWVDQQTMQSPTGQQETFSPPLLQHAVASLPPSTEESVHKIVSRDRDHGSTEILNNNMHQQLSAGATITNRKRSSLEAMVDQTSDRLAELVSPWIPANQHRQLGAGLVSLQTGVRTSKFQSLEAGRGVGCDDDDEQAAGKLDPAAVSALLYEERQAAAATTEQNLHHCFLHLPDSSLSDDHHLSSRPPPPKMRRRHGTATDPQSIAARTRREKFSDRIRILQTLVPNGERLDTVSTLGQTLEYVRFLQHQVWEFYNGGNEAAACGGAHESEAAAAMPEKWKEFKEHTITAGADHIVA